MKIVRYFFDVPPTYEPRSPSSSGDGGGGDGVPILVLLGIFAVYAYGYSELVQFIGLSAIWAALLFLPFTITLIMSPDAVARFFGWVSGAGTDDKDGSSKHEGATADSKSEDAGEEHDEGAVEAEESGFGARMERVDGATIATVRGRIDAKSVNELEQVIRSEIGVRRPVILDVSNVPYISSSGLRMILLLMRSFNEKGLTFALAAPSPSVRELFVVSGFTCMLPIYEDLPEAIAAIADVKCSEQ